MTNKSKPATDLAAAVRALHRHLLEKGNRFDRGSRYEGQNNQNKALSDVTQTVRMYEGMGYAKLMQLGEPPIYAALSRGHQEVHIFQPQDPKIREWLEDDKVSMNDPAMHAYLLQSAGLSENDLPVASKPQRFHITEVDGVFILASEDAPPERR